MPSIHETPDDDPNVPAQNIVGAYWKEGRCYYEGRPQGSKVAALTDDELAAKLRAKRLEIIGEQGCMAREIYPHESAWDLRVFQP